MTSRAHIEHLAYQAVRRAILPSPRRHRDVKSGRFISIRKVTTERLERELGRA